MQAEVPCSSVGLLAAMLVLQADPLKPCYSISKTAQTTRERKTVAATGLHRITEW